jgi:hydroxymethylbilane synthase
MNQTSHKIRIGTRASKLALAQVAEVHLLLDPFLKNLEIEIVPIKTSGDKIQDRNLSDIGGKGLFIKELEEALVQNKIDIAIHSAKDVPPQLHAETHLSAFTERLDARDCFISKKYDSLKKLPKGATIGTSSPRRKAILLLIRPDLKIVNFRGNVDTRLGKIENEEVDGSILAVCGLERIGKDLAIKQMIEKDVMLPSGGQGSLAIQTRKNDKKIFDLLQNINHEPTQIEVTCERAYLAELGASCATPVGVHATTDAEEITLKTLILDYDGSAIFETKSKGKAEMDVAIKLAVEAAKKTKNEAAELLEKICK